jgi:hypothetical protein
MKRRNRRIKKIKNKKLRVQLRWSKERTKKDFKLKIQRRNLNLRLKKRERPRNFI